MNVPTNPGFYRVKIRLDGNGGDGFWKPAHVYLRSGGGLSFSTTGCRENLPVDDEWVLEWGKEIVVDEFGLFMKRLEEKVDEVAKGGCIGKFLGFEITEKFTKKALMGVIVRIDEWARKAGICPGIDYFIQRDDELKFVGDDS